MSEVGESPTKPTLARRSLLKATLGLAALATGSSINPTPEQQQTKEAARSLQEIIKAPTPEEIEGLKTKLAKDIEQPFTYEKQTHTKNDLIFDFITTKTPDNRSSSVIMVRKNIVGKSVKDLQDIVIYFHSIDGAASDVASFHEDFSNIWNNGGAVIFPVTKGFKGALEGANATAGKVDDFFKIEDQNNTTKYLAKEEGSFDDNSPIDVLQGLHNILKVFPELKEKEVEIDGISLGGSTAIQTLTMWESFAKKHTLPGLKKVNLYAPVNTLLDQKIMTQALQEGSEANRLGVHRIFRSLTKSVAASFRRYMIERFKIQKVPIINSDQRNVFLIDKGDPKKGIPPQNTQQKENISDQDANLLVDNLTKKYNLTTKDSNTNSSKDFIGYFTTVEENLTRILEIKNDNSVGLETLREKLMMFSPDVMLNVMKSMGERLPDAPINIVYANFDSVVPPNQSKRLAQKLKGEGANVKTTEIIGGHILNPYIKQMLSFIRK